MYKLSEDSLYSIMGVYLLWKARSLWLLENVSLHYFFQIFEELKIERVGRGRYSLHCQFGGYSQYVSMCATDIITAREYVTHDVYVGLE